ncbi:hypothetical protein L0337_20795 [candidate division KSB1 bacterium]|nr:hypothetical protein [candidate division KSB1 bacterium]
MIWKILLLSSCLLGEHSFLHAQIPPEARSALQNRPYLSVLIYQAETSITAALDIDVVLTNLQSKAFDVDSVAVFLPERMKAIRPTLSAKLIEKVESLPPGSQRTYRLSVPSVEIPWQKYFYETETLLLAPGEYVVKGLVQYHVSGETNIHSMEQTAPITLAPPLSAVVRGGVLGALFLAIFVPAYRKLHAAKTGQPARTEKLLAQAMTFFLAGSVVSTITILLLQRLGNLDLPIIVTVKDYLGGMVIGFFSYKIGDALYGLLFSKE